jgi:ribokinase
MSIVVFGSINIDLVVQCQHLPLPGETLLGGGFLIAPGGKGANQAVACARLGAPTYMVGRVGADSFGTIMRSSLDSNGVITSGIINDSTQPTGVALITVETSGENTIVVAPGANGNVSLEDVARMSPLLSEASVLLLQLEIPLDTVVAAACAAREQGITVILDPAPAPAHDLPDDLYRVVDILTPNESEAARLVGFQLGKAADVERAAQILMERTGGSVVIKLGGRGAYLLDGKGGEFRPAIEVQLIDTVAAGDAFNGGLATALSEGNDLRTALNWGLAGGGLAVTKVGAQPSLPRRQSVLDILAALV